MSFRSDGEVVSSQEMAVAIFTVFSCVPHNFQLSKFVGVIMKLLHLVQQCNQVFIDKHWCWL